MRDCLTQKVLKFSPSPSSLIESFYPIISVYVLIMAFSRDKTISQSRSSVLAGVHISTEVAFFIDAV